MSETVSEEEFYEACKANGLTYAKKSLRNYVRDGQPGNFCPGSTARMMCGLASMAVEGKSMDEWPGTYLLTKYGPELYDYMWS